MHFISALSGCENVPFALVTQPTAVSSLDIIFKCAWRSSVYRPGSEASARWGRLDRVVTEAPDRMTSVSSSGQPWKGGSGQGWDEDSTPTCSRGEGPAFYARVLSIARGGMTQTLAPSETQDSSHSCRIWCSGLLKGEQKDSEGFSEALPWMVLPSSHLFSQACCACLFLLPTRKMLLVSVGRWVVSDSLTIAHQAPLSMGFPKQEYWSR